MTFSQQDLVEEMNRLIRAAEEKDIHLRAMGGLAVQAHNKLDNPLFNREIADLDLVAARKQRRGLESFMQGVGYSPDKQFNILNGDQRQIYYREGTDLKVDIFVGDFVMCHKIPLENRLAYDPVTIPLAELLLSKTQVVELNHKDALDIASLLLSNETGEDDDNKINLKIIAGLCSQDWGLYKTTSINLNRVDELIRRDDFGLTQNECELVRSKVKKILKTFEDMPKPMAWQLRDRVGTRVKWYEEVEEVAR